MKKLLIIVLLSITASSQAMFKGLNTRSVYLATTALKLSSTRSLCCTQKACDKYNENESEIRKLKAYFNNHNEVQNEIIRSMRKSFLIAGEIYKYHNDSEKLMVLVAHLNKETKYLNETLNKIDKIIESKS